MPSLLSFADHYKLVSRERALCCSNRLQIWIIERMPLDNIIHAKMLYYYDFQTRTFIHLFDECNQNWFSVASIIEDSLTTVKRQESRLNEAFLRSDNAGCYHCTFLILSLQSLGQRVGVRIARYDFSEAQAWKDICDCRAADLKSHIRRYINEGNDIKTASDMKAAIDSHGGVKGCYSAVCKVDERSQNMTKHSLSDIQSLNNFMFTESGEIIAWRAYNVGPGKVPQRRWRVSVPLKARRTYNFTKRSVVLAC